MTDRRTEEPGKDTQPVPRDLPDQQVGGTGGDDPWDAAEIELDESADDEVPDTDQAAPGPQGTPRTSGVPPKRPIPDEPTD